MRRVAILYNPRSGLARSRRQADVERAAAIFRTHAVEVVSQATAGPRCAGGQATQFIAEGFDTIVACGGDGTVHDVLQGTVGTDAVLGVLPLGTANSLACDLGLRRDPAKAAHQLVSAEVRRFAIGEMKYQHHGQQECRYFTVAAGVGVDAALFYTLNAQFKQRWGMAAYVGESLRQWLIQKFYPFRVQWFDIERQQLQTDVVTQMLAVRIADFGGVLKKLAPGADLSRDDLRLVLFKTASRTRYMRFVIGRLLGRNWRDSRIQMVYASRVSCEPLDTARPGAVVHAEADGELLGRLPVQISISPRSFNLLVPAKK